MTGHPTRPRTSVTVLALFALVLTGLISGTGTGQADGSPPAAEVSLPPEGLRSGPYGTSLIDLDAAGYVEEEFLVSGIARGDVNGSALPDQPYVSRILVRRPDGVSFSGTVWMEWVNVTAVVDHETDWSEFYKEILREGHVFIGLSAQRIGVEALKDWDPVRYGSLSHPGDDPYSYEILTQVAQALRSPGAIDPLDGLTMDRLIASGHSQSGSRMRNYINGPHRDARVVDGFFVRGTGSKTFPNLDTPVLQYLAEREVSSSAGDDPSAVYRRWEIAGGSHGSNLDTEYWLFNQVPRDWAGKPSTFDESVARQYGEEGGQGSPCLGMSGAKPGENPQWATMSNALFQLDRWLRDSVAPVQPEMIELDAIGQIVRDEHGNARGGYRLPTVDVPVATYDGACGLGGNTMPFSSEKLATLYASHDDYVSQMGAAISDAVEAELMRPLDGAELLARAETSPVGR